MAEEIVILDFGSQYTQVIARRIRECKVYSTILRYDTPAAEIARRSPKGHHPLWRSFQRLCQGCAAAGQGIFELGVPILGICYGMQLLAQYLGGKVEPGQKREYGKGTLTVNGRVVPALSKAFPKAAGLELAWRQAHRLAAAV